MCRRGCARKIERYCCTAASYFPLLFVYGLTTWAVWVEVGIGSAPSKKGHVWIGMRNHLGRGLDGCAQWDAQRTGD